MIKLTLTRNRGPVWVNSCYIAAIVTPTYYPTLPQDFTSEVILFSHGVSYEVMETPHEIIRMMAERG